MRYYLKAIWYFIAVTVITLAVIGILAIPFYFMPKIAMVTVCVSLIILCFASIIKDIADDLRWNDHFKNRENDS